MVRSFFVAALLAIGVLMGAASAKAEEIACYTRTGHPVYDADFCRAIKIGREALELNRKVLDKSEAIRQSIDRQLKQMLDDSRPASKPGG